jgi:hypothetical protein
MSALFRLSMKNRPRQPVERGVSLEADWAAMANGRFQLPGWLQPSPCGPTRTRHPRGSKSRLLLRGLQSLEKEVGPHAVGTRSTCPRFPTGLRRAEHVVHVFASQHEPFSAHITQVQRLPVASTNHASDAAPIRRQEFGVLADDALCIPACFLQQVDIPLHVGNTQRR